MLCIQVSHCLATRRIAVGTKAGSMVMYELRASKVQTIPAHQEYIRLYDPTIKLDNKHIFLNISTRKGTYICHKLLIF